MKYLKLILPAVAALISLTAYADTPDHRVALRIASENFAKAFEACEFEKTKDERNQCRGIAKQVHTKAIERADRIATAK